MKNIPEKIYLQVDADGETPEDFDGLSITWCPDKIHDNDIEYVLPRPVLIDFFAWFRDNGEELIGLTIEQFVDEYLKERNENV